MTGDVGDLDGQTDDWMRDIPDGVAKAGDKPKKAAKPGPGPRMKEKPEDEAVRAKVTGAVGKDLRDIVLRIEELEAQKAQVAGAISAAYAGAKANGFDKKALRWVIKRRSESEADAMARHELEAVGQLYMEAVML